MEKAEQSKRIRVDVDPDLPYIARIDELVHVVGGNPLQITHGAQAHRHRAHREQERYRPDIP